MFASPSGVVFAYATPDRPAIITFADQETEPDSPGLGPWNKSAAPGYLSACRQAPSHMVQDIREAARSRQTTIAPPGVPFPSSTKKRPAYSSPSRFAVT